jgi:hypothetical protein
MQLSNKRDEILSALRHAARGPLRDEDAIWLEIETVMDAAANEQCGWNPKTEIDRCIHALALIYACSTGARPAFTNCESGTRFEHFVMAIPMPAQFRITRNRIKASIRRVVAPRDSGFTRRILARTTPHAVP